MLSSIPETQLYPLTFIHQLISFSLGRWCFIWSRPTKRQHGKATVRMLGMRTIRPNDTNTHGARLEDNRSQSEKWTRHKANEPHTTNKEESIKRTSEKQTRSQNRFYDRYALCVMIQWFGMSSYLLCLGLATFCWPRVCGPIDWSRMGRSSSIAVISYISHETRFCSAIWPNDRLTHSTVISSNRLEIITNKDQSHLFVGSNVDEQSNID